MAGGQRAKLDQKRELTLIQLHRVHPIVNCKMEFVEHLMDLAVGALSKASILCAVWRVCQRRHRYMVPMMPEMVEGDRRAGKILSIPIRYATQMLKPPSEHLWGDIGGIIVLDLDENTPVRTVADGSPFCGGFRLKWQRSVLF